MGKKLLTERRTTTKGYTALVNFSKDIQTVGKRPHPLGKAIRH